MTGIATQGRPAARVVREPTAGSDAKATLPKASRAAQRYRSWRRTGEPDPRHEVVGQFESPGQSSSPDFMILGELSTAKNGPVIRSIRTGPLPGTIQG